ncbi:MAG: hypothetical protein IPL53_10375 [Ignavibacteria bacterium]|nr:hypothetical protein [Ignavibacteria bacterium]
MKNGNTKKKTALKKSVKTTAKKISVNEKGADSSSGSSKLFTIVAIGASAGGLEAYTKIIANLLPDTGMAFVIIQHLSADYKSLLKDILKHRTQMPVISVTNGMKPQPNKIYISPPTSTISFSNGIFKLKTRTKIILDINP